jgi:hypothetical protein
MPSYPSELPTESLKAVFEIVRQGDFVIRRADLANHGWWLQGYLFKVTFGDVEQPVFGSMGEGYDVELTDATACSMLERLLPAEPGEVEVKGITPLWIPLAMWLLKLLLSRLAK